MVRSTPSASLRRNLKDLVEAREPKPYLFSVGISPEKFLVRSLSPKNSLFIKKTGGKSIKVVFTQFRCHQPSKEPIWNRAGYAVVFYMRICGCGLCKLICAYPQPHETSKKKPYSMFGYGDIRLCEKNAYRSVCAG